MLYKIQIIYQIQCNVRSILYIILLCMWLITDSDVTRLLVLQKCVGNEIFAFEL